MERLFLGVSLHWIQDNGGMSSLLAFFSCFIATLMGFYAITGHLHHYGKPQYQRYIVRILAVIPVYSVASWLSLELVHFTAVLYVDTIRDCYEAFVIYSFLNLVLSFAGGESSCVASMQLVKTDIPHLFPLCCLSPLPRDGRLLRRCKRSALQFVIIKPLFAVLSLVMLACGKYHSKEYQWVLFVVYNTSYSIALYWLVVFYQATKHALAEYHPVRKFVAVKIVIFLTFWQTVCIGEIPGITQDEAMEWKEFVLCIEMPLFASILCCAFSASDFRQQFERMPESDVLNNIKEVLSVKDIVADAIHNFKPSYQEYVLQRMEEDAPEDIQTSKAFLEEMNDSSNIKQSVDETKEESNPEMEAIEIGSHSTETSPRTFSL